MQYRVRLWGCIREVSWAQAVGTCTHALGCPERAELPDDKDGWARMEHARTYPTNQRARRCLPPTARCAPERPAANRRAERGCHIHQSEAPARRSCDVSRALQPMGLKNRWPPYWYSLLLIGPVANKRHVTINLNKNYCLLIHIRKQALLLVKYKVIIIIIIIIAFFNKRLTHATGNKLRQNQTGSRNKEIPVWNLVPSFLPLSL